MMIYILQCMNIIQKYGGKIEDFFKLLKQGLNLREIHKYTPKSVAKTLYLNAFLGALIIS